MFFRFVNAGPLQQDGARAPCRDVTSSTPTYKSPAAAATTASPTLPLTLGPCPCHWPCRRLSRPPRRPPHPAPRWP
eukprot:1035024-Prymnesium_polylepis.3